MKLKTRILIVAIVISLLVVIFPPFQLARFYDDYVGHAFFLSPPGGPSTISLKYLGIELAGIWLVAGLVYLITNKIGNKD